MKRLKERFKWEREPVFLIDGSSFIYRAFYAYPGLKTSTGFPTNAIFILLRIILKLLKEQRPEYACFIIDGKGETFRHKLYPQYKANRQKMPEPLVKQIPPILEGVSLLGLKTLVAEEKEADDLIASLTLSIKRKHPVVITGIDKDLLQLLDKNVIIWDPSSKRERIFTLEGFLKKEEISPSSWPLYQALVGDKSDNIAGVPGIGPKGARSIVKRFPSLDELKANLHKLPPQQQLKLKGHLEQLSRDLLLTSLDASCKEEITPGELKVSPPRIEELMEFLRRYEFTSLLREVEATYLSKTSVEEKEPSLPSPVPLPASMAPMWRCAIAVIDNKIILGNGERDFVVESVDRLIEVVKESRVVFVHSLKALLSIMGEQGYPLLKEKAFDLSLAAYLYNPEMKDYSLKSLSRAFVPIVGESTTTSGQIMATGQYLHEILRENNLLKLLSQIEMPLVPVLIEMENNGVKIDISQFKRFLKEVEGELKALEERIHHTAGEKFNIRSNKQLAHVLFKRLGLTPIKKTPKGEPSTAGEVLEMLRTRHPIIPLILSYRRLEKIRSTYLSPLPRLADSRGRIHTRFNQTGTATGRLSSSHPNLQNIPIRGELGPRVRALFVPEEGNFLLSADYSQIELRILAHFAKDPYLMEAFFRGEDIHRHTAALLFDKPPLEVSSEERRKAKTINFGLLYGMGPQKLSREMGISLGEAREFIELYFSKLVKVKEFFSRVEEEAKEKGYVTTLSGRRRYLPDINSKNENLASQARRMAINTVIQGSAADIIKMAMIEIYHHGSLREKHTSLLLQIHDELLFEVPAPRAPEVGEEIAEIMSRVLSLEVPLVVDWGYGKNWAEAH